MATDYSGHDCGLCSVHHDSRARINVHKITNSQFSRYLKFSKQSVVFLPLFFYHIPFNHPVDGVETLGKSITNQSTSLISKKYVDSVIFLTNKFHLLIVRLSSSADNTSMMYFPKALSIVCGFTFMLVIKYKNKFQFQTVLKNNFGWLYKFD